MELIQLKIGLWMLITMYLIWCFYRGKYLITQWAQHNKYELRSIKRCLTDRGPFKYSSTRGQEVYIASVYDSINNTTRECWIQTGKLWALGFKEPLNISWK